MPVLALLAPAGHATPTALPLITDAPDDSVRLKLNDDLPATARMHDAGNLAPGQIMDHIQLVLRRPPALQRALDTLAHDQLDPASPRFRHWLLPSQLRAFGPAAQDIATVAAWARNHGLRVNAVARSGMSMDLSGTAAAFDTSFATSIHRFTSAAGINVGPSVAPSIPAALAPAVRGVTLGNFFPRPALRPVGGVAGNADGSWRVVNPSPDFTINVKGGAYEAVAPFDFYYIYDVLPLFYNASDFGVGQQVAVVEQSDIQTADYKSFDRAFFVLPLGKLTQVHPGNCGDPGLATDEGEAAIDAEWAASTSSNAGIEVAACAASVNSFGVMTSFQNLVEQGTQANILSVSYGACETQNGISFTTMWNDIAEMGATEGLSIFVSSGDSGVAGCDAPGDQFGARFGLAVNALASSPYVTAVGGTDFADTARGETAQYWAPSSGENPYTKATALSYVPEIVWSDSCAGTFVTAYLGFPNPAATCAAAMAGTYPGLLNLVGSGGGKSVVFAKPDWQSLGFRGMPNDGARDLPDISLFAGNGLWNHFYLYCMSDAAEGGYPCKYPDHGTTAFYSGAGGTSFGAPAMAGLQALIAFYVNLHVNHILGKPLRLGNAAPRLYQLAAIQYAQSLLVQDCQANRGNRTSAACIFHEVTDGDNDVFCQNGPDCIEAYSTGQLLSKNPKKYVPTYTAHLGYNQATGLGSIDAYNLVINY